MRKALVLICICVFALSVAFLGCVKKAASSTEAIQASKAMKTAQEQVDYLVSQANAFYSSKEFKEAISIADYVVANLDKNSQQAKDIIAKAKKELAVIAQKKIDEVKGKFGIK